MKPDAREGCFTDPDANQPAYDALRAEAAKVQRSVPHSRVAVSDSWQAVAHKLAARLMHHAYCEDRHIELQPDCPFCEDISAYQAYRTKCDETGRIAMVVSAIDNSPIIPLSEVLAQRHA